MNLLVFDSSTSVGCVGVLVDGVLRAELTLSVQRTHSEHLMPAVEEAIRASGIELSDLDAVGVGIGPGSYTGIRISLGTAMGIAYALGVPAVPVSTLETLAMSAWPAFGVVIPLLDARRSQVYAGVYRSRSDAPYLEELVEPQVLEVEDLSRLVGEESAIMVGDGSVVYQEKIQSTLGSRGMIVPAALSHPQAARLGLLAQAKFMRNESISPFELKPVYLRRPYVIE